MLRGLTPQQFTAWEAFDQLSPIGDRRADMRAALVAQTFANINRDPKRRKEPYTIEDFMLVFTPEEVKKPQVRKQGWQEQKAIAIAIAMAHNIDESRSTASGRSA